MNNEYISDPCNISSGMFGIRYSYSDNYYATHGEDRGCTGGRDSSFAFNAFDAIRGISSVHGENRLSSFFLLIVTINSYILLID